jgi:hypothetical protein
MKNPTQRGRAAAAASGPITGMPPEDLTSFDVSHLDALAQLEGNRRAIRALSEKAAWRRDREVEIYSRVMADYESRMAAIMEQAAPVRQRVRDDLQKLEALYKRFSAALDQARVQLQECEFRHEIGEFTPEEFERCQQSAERTIGEREAEFEGVRKLRQRYLDLLPDEPVSETKPTRAPTTSSPAPPVAAVVTPAPVPSARESFAPPVPTTSLPTTASSFQEPMLPADDRTVFLRPPSDADFKLPPGGGASGDTAAFGTVPVTSAMLIEDNGGLPGAHHRLGAMTVMGRTPDNEIVVPNQEVSRRHAQIIMVDEGYVLKDLDAPNGTFVNGERITEHRLQEGDRVSLGGKVFIFKAP